MAMQKGPYTTRLIKSFRTRGVVGSLKQAWIRFWMLFVGTGPAGRFAARLAACFLPPDNSRLELRYLSPKGFVEASATVYGKDIHLGPNTFVGDGTVLFQAEDGGAIDIGAGATISRGTTIETSRGGSVAIGEGTALQPHCFLSAAEGSIRLGADVGVAPHCAFYPHNHGIVEGQSISSQPLVVKGDIVVEDGAWLGHGVIVLSGVRIGKGAVIGAGSTVACNVPDGAVAWGVPAKVFMKRKRLAEVAPLKDSPASDKVAAGRDASLTATSNMSTKDR